MKKFIIFLFLFVLLFSLFCYAQSDTAKIDAAQNELIGGWDFFARWFDKNKYNLKDKLKNTGNFNTANEYLFSFLENNSQLFKSEKEADILFNNMDKNPQLFTVLDNNPELFNIINQNPELFINILLDEQKLELFINAPSQSEFLFNSGYSKESLFNSTSNSKFINTDVSQKEENYTVGLWKEWGIMK